MNDFKDFNIEPSEKGFVGDKVKIEWVLNIRIRIYKYRIVPSKFGGDRLDMQIEMNGTKHVLWSSSKNLIEMIEKVPKDRIPFNTTIIKRDRDYIFS